MIRASRSAHALLAAVVLAPALACTAQTGEGVASDESAFCISCIAQTPADCLVGGANSVGIWDLKAPTLEAIGASYYGSVTLTRGSAAINPVVTVDGVPVGVWDNISGGLEVQPSIGFSTPMGTSPQTHTVSITGRCGTKTQTVTTQPATPTAPLIKLTATPGATHPGQAVHLHGEADRPSDTTCQRAVYTLREQVIGGPTTTTPLGTNSVGLVSFDFDRAPALTTDYTLTAACENNASAVGSATAHVDVAPSGPQTSTAPMTLYPYPPGIGGGPVGWAGAFPSIGTIQGNAISLTNPSGFNAPTVFLLKPGHFVSECAALPNNISSFVLLAPGQSITDFSALGVAAHPTLPIQLVACSTQAPTVPVTLSVTYTHP